MSCASPHTSDPTNPIWNDQTMSDRPTPSRTKADAAIVATHGSTRARRMTTRSSTAASRCSPMREHLVRPVVANAEHVPEQAVHEDRDRRPMLVVGPEQVVEARRAPMREEVPVVEEEPLLDAHGSDTAGSRPRPPRRTPPRGTLRVSRTRRISAPTPHPPERPDVVTRRSHWYPPHGTGADGAPILVACLRRPQPSARRRDPAM